MAMDEVQFGDDFGQKIDLTVRIREILRNYPEGTSVLKEMVQNADDAGATTISFCLDKRTHGAEHLAYTKLASFQGPSLLVHNDARFTDADFASIQRIGDSLKKDASQGWKTGLASTRVRHQHAYGSHIVMFDPHACHLPNVNPSNPGKMINFMTRRDLLEQYPDQFCPFEGFGCDLRSPFDGTTFRLPLRTPEQAKTSKLTSRAQTLASVSQLLDDFAHESTMMLLFLRNVTTIHISQWETGQSAPTPLYTTSITNLSRDLQAQRSQASLKAQTFPLHGQICDYPLKITTRDFGSNNEATSTWLICNQLGGKESTAMATDPENASLRLVPYGGVAASLDISTPLQGRAFCFLPLPVETGLPIHVNGYFELSSNRRDVWSGDGLTGEGLLRAQWNTSLLASVIAPCYARAIEAMTQYHTSPHLFPLQLPLPPWQALVTSALTHVADKPCLYTLTKTFVAPKDALVLGPSQDKDALEPLLVHDGLGLVSLPPPLQTLLCATKTIPIEFGPRHARAWYRTHTTCHGSNAAAMHTLLAFVLRDGPRDDLDGVQLLPLMDHSVGRFVIQAPVDTTGLQQLLSMQFPRSLCVAALQKHENDAQAALEWLLTGPSATMCTSNYYLCSPLELKLFGASCRQRLVDMEAIGDCKAMLLALAAHVNVQVMGVQDLGDFFPLVLPPHWARQSRVAWSIDATDLPTLAWFQDLWAYIGNSPSTLLDLCDQWPIVPTQNGAVCSLRKQSSILHTAWLAPSIVAILLRMQVDVLAHDLFRTEVSSDVWTYFQQPTPEGVVASLSRDRVEMLSAAERDELRTYILSLHCDDMSASTVQALRSLPLFHGFGVREANAVVWDEADDRSLFVPLTPGLCVAPEIEPRLLDGRFVVHPELSKKVLHKLGLPTISCVNFFMTSMFAADVWSTLQIEMQLSLLEAFLLHVTTFVRDDPRFIGRAQQLKVFATMTGSWRYVTELYDPDIEAFVDMIEPSCFPSASLQTPAYLGALRLLGMQQMLTRSSVLHIAEVIATTQADDETTRVEFQSRTKEFVKYVDAHADRLLQPQLLQGFLDSRSSTLQDDDEDEVDEAALQSEMQDIIAFREQLVLLAWMPVLQTPPYACLPWPSSPPLVTSPLAIRPAETQWLCSASFFILDGAISSVSLRQLFGWDASHALPVLLRQLVELHATFHAIGSDDTHLARLAAQVPTLYAALAAYLVNDSNAANVMQNALHNVPWLWIRDRFWRADQVAFDSYVHAHEYLAVVPKELLPYEHLLSALGVRRRFHARDYVGVLEAMFTAHNNNNKTLSKEDVALAIQLAQTLSDEVSTGLDVYLPTASNALQVASSLLFNDAPWLAQPPGLVFVHPQLSNVVAGKLGAVSFRSSLLRSSSTALDGLEPEALDGVTAFGQSEPLTRRLAHILEQYPEGTSVLHELVQNADDAGATRVSVCLNLATYATSSLLSAPMAAWQGPALYCYNNAAFQERDFMNLARIGQGSKLHRVSTTGRFGLGFNSVYHLTDLPSIVSGSSLVMFDPHATFVPNATATQPGIKINFTSSNVIAQFPDQFAPYKLFGCTLEEPYHGTLFRFPFRTAGVHSEIKRAAYTEHDMHELITQFQSSLAATMLFLRHVEHIAVYIKNDDDGCEPRLLYEATVPPRPSNALDAFASKDAFYRQLQRQAAPSIDHHVLSVTLSEPGNAAPLTETYLMAIGMGAGSAKAMALQHPELKLIPYVGIAARLDVVPTLLDGRAFCFLPLPVKVGLPVHINGYFELSSNRRDIWHGDDMTGEGRMRSEWNKALLVDAVAPTYLSLLLHVQAMVSNEHYLALLPPQRPPSPWSAVVDTLYARVGAHKLVYCETSGAYVPFNMVLALDPALASARATEVMEILRLHGLSYASFSPPLHALLLEKNVLLGATTPSTFRQLVHAERIRLQTLPPQLVPALVKLCVDDIRDEAQLEMLHALPLLVLRDQSVRSILLRGQGDAVYVCSSVEQTLLEGMCPHLVLNMELCGSILRALPGFVTSANVKLFDLHELGTIASSLFPPAWRQKPRVPFVAHPSRPMAWWKALWSYVDDQILNGRDVPTSLLQWPIKPVRINTSNTALMPLDAPVLASLQGLRGDRDNILDFLKDHDLYVLDTSLFPNERCPSWMLSSGFAFACDAPGLLSLLSRGTAIAAIPLPVARAFRALLVEADCATLSLANQATARSLPIFELSTLGGASTLVALDSATYLLPPLGFAYAPPPLLSVASLDERAFCIAAGLAQVSHDDALLDHVLPHLTFFDEHMQLELLVQEVFLRYASMAPAVQTRLRETVRVPTADANSAPRLLHELHDPTSEALQGLLGPSSFPTPLLAAHLAVMKDMGLQQSISCLAMLESARSIETAPDAMRAAYLLGVVNQHLDAVYAPERDIEAVAALCAVAWLPIQTSRPLEVLPWTVATGGVASPRATWPQEWMWYGSATKCILNGHVTSNVLRDACQWTLSADVVAQQLVAIAERHASSAVVLDDMTFLHQRVANVYATLETCIADLSDDEGWKAPLTSAPWIWTTSMRFVRVCQVAHDGPEHVAPVLVTVADTRVPSALLEAFAIKASFDTDDYVRALTFLPRDEPLQASDMALVTVLLGLLEKSPDSVNNVLLPDANGILAPATELVVDDMAWHKSSDASRGRRRFVHPSVVPQVALRFGAVSKHALVANASSNSVKMMCPHLVAIKAHLPEAHYASWATKLLRDMLDVAEALACPRVDVVVDMRVHADQKVCRPSFQALQRDAIVFHLHDVHVQPETLFLKYGKGSAGLLSGLFVSDCVQVLSGTDFYVIDPSGTYLEQASTLRYNTQTPEFASFSDQLAPFVSLPSRQSGTIVRCPLRTTPDSKLRPALTRHDVDMFLTTATAFAPTSVLFSSYLRQLSLWHLTPEVRTCTIDVALQNADRVLSQRLSLLQDDEWRKPKPTGLFGNVFKRSMTLPVAISDVAIQVTAQKDVAVHHWCVSANVAVGRTQDLAKSVPSLSPHASVAHLVRTTGSATVPRIRGQLFAPFATDVYTGLPVHVHAGFGLDAPSLHVPVRGLGPKNHAMDEWNLALLEDAVTEAYVQLLSTLKANAIAANVPRLLYGAWPALRRSTELGRLVQRSMHPKLSQLELFLCGDGSYRRLTEGYFMEPSMPLQVAAYARLHFPMFTVPSSVMTATTSMQSTPRLFTPRVLREWLKRVAASSLHVGLCHDLLAYCLRDLTPMTYGELAGLPVLALADGSVGTVPKASLFSAIAAEPFIVATLDQQLLLPSMRTRFLALEFCRAFDLTNVRLINALGAVPFSVTFLAQHIASELPPAWRNKDRVVWSPSQDVGVSALWLGRFWKEVGKKEHVQLFHAWPLLPIAGKHELLRCRYMDDVLVLTPGSASLDLAASIAHQRQVAIADDDAQHAAYLHERHVMDALAKQELHLDDDEEEEEGEGEADDEAKDLNVPGSEVAVDASEISLEVDDEAANLAAHDATVVEEDAAVVSESEGTRRLHPLLARLDVPILELGFVPEAQHHEWLVRPRDAALMILSGLSKWSQAGRLQWPTASQADREELVAYFADHGTLYGGFNQRRKDQLRGLPLYYSLLGDECILSHDTYYLVDESVAGFPAYLPEHTKQSFLHVPRPSLLSFFKELDVECLTEADMVAKFVVDRFDAFDVVQRTALLDTIQRKWPIFQRNASLVAFLQTTPLFPTRDGLIVPASTLLDPTHAVLASILLPSFPESFPTPEYATPAWLDILHALGMTHELSTTVFARCANHVASWPTPLSSEHEAGALALHEAFARHYDKYERARSFLEELASIAFVPAIEHSLSGPDRTILARYSDCAVPSDEAVVFFAKPIVLAYAVPPRVLWRRLDVVSPPPATDVLLTLERVTSDATVLDDWSHAMSVSELFQKLFAYCDAHWDKLGHAMQTRLCELPLLPIGTRFVKASRVYVRLPENLAPFLFEVPRAFGAYDHLFARLGTKESPSANDYAQLLAELATECMVLNLNELRAVVKIVALVAETELTLSYPLMLPTTTHELVPLHVCVANDATARRLAVRMHMQLASIHVVHGMVSDSVVRALHVPSLLDLVVEELCPGEVLTPTIETSAMTAVLRSDAFGRGLASVCVGSEDDMVVRFREHGIYAVETLSTRLYLRNGRVDVTKDTSSLCFIDEATKVLYVTTPGSLSLAQVVALCIQRSMPHALLDCSPVVAMLESTDIPQTLQYLGVGSRRVLQARGVPGAPLCDVDMRALELKPLRSFLPGEVVAIEGSNHEHVYATVVAEQTTFGLKQVQLCVDTKHTTKWLPSTQVFSFQSVRQASTTTSAATLTTTAVQSAAVTSVPSSTPSLPISETQVLDAVNELLGRVNMSLSAPYEALVQETLRLKQRLAHAEESYRAASERIEEALVEKKEVLEAMTCSVCFENDVNRVLVPCGHVFCSACVGRFPRNKCPTCRHDISTHCAFHKPY
ncbi:hypothetical protein SPRG_05600 [Saprolegnia parasitica CBS 223.65]|uniref:RING-type domain-containing protein n=1 Tax=Saprolegnia parasitica (strain CBS 223.65) TaxID=695850 RepID=A0A067CGM9_SAPPC|nr:hypothetical protein SPRG_05600 [Saprolegnia parasitica CBS 223.65]KDO29648.1 hypothetical protein SPRG_05600 [Saprolegnia parasitica CBS 223.65]|eukprot:XP_012199707.1 hypothetical protein SPRG_05600 [Saprolegnia parasitica CBS 223.65]